MTTIKLTFDNQVTLDFRVFKTDIAGRWVEALREGIATCPLDDPRRFYGFDSQEEEEQRALTLINTAIDTINDHDPLISRHLEDVYDQDYLNILHHCFEVFHGGLDEPHEYFLSAPPNVRKALADLNIHVHRCEKMLGRLGPGIVCTWYGLAKNRYYTKDDLLQLTNLYKFGTIYINYAEIGKTLHDLADDGDDVDPDSFRPVNVFSADFALKFYDVPEELANSQRKLAWEYYAAHLKEFEALGWGRDCGKLYQLEPGRVPVAKIETTMTRNEVIDSIRPHQVITAVDIIE